MSKLIIVISCLIYALIFLGQIMGITSANDLVERKEIAKFPQLSLENKNLITELNRYFQDNYGFRNILLKDYLFIKFNLFKSQRLGNVEYIDNAMTIGGESAWQESSEAYKHILYTEEELLSWKNFLEREKEYVESHHMHYFLVVVPSRDLYGDNLTSYEATIPLFMHRQFVDYIKENSSIEIIDPLDVLVKAKGQLPLTYKSDSHWTNYGAYIAYLEIMKLISKYEPSVKAYQKEDFDINLEKYDLWLGELGFNYPGNQLSPDYGVKFILKNSSQNKYPKLRALLVYGDSYTTIQRRICIPCMLQKFPEVKPIIPFIFVQPEVDKSDRDPNPGYWYPRDRIENLIPVIKHSNMDKKVQDRFINYLLVQSILPDHVGLDFFTKLNFNKVVNRDIEMKVDQSQIDEYEPEFVMREVVDPRIRHSFDVVKCLYKWNKNFNNVLHYQGC